MAKNSAVDLVVSGGPNIPTVEVPTVTGKQLTQAIALLQAANLGYTVHNVTSNQPVGTVLSQDPAGGHQDPRDAQGDPDGLGHAELGLGAERDRAVARPRRQHPAPRPA